MVDNKQIGGIIVTAVALIVGIIMLTAAAQNGNDILNTVSVDVNITAPANDTAYYFTSYRALNDVTITNASNDAAISSGNYTITNNFIYNDDLVVRLVPDADTGFQETSWNVVATAEPLAYGDSATRTIFPLVILFGALALMVVAAIPSLRSGLVDYMKK